MGVYGLLSPRIPIFSPYKYHGSTRTLGVHPSLSLETHLFSKKNTVTGNGSLLLSDVVLNVLMGFAKPAMLPGARS